MTVSEAPKNTQKEPEEQVEEQVVLLDEAGRSIGAAAKRGVHHTQTPLHLAFSCYVFDPAGGALLVTRRALDKPTWPGVWTNSFCGHPGPGEQMTEAVRRRAEQELGIVVADLRVALPAFRYRAVMADGVVENEMCPVFVAATESDVRPDPDEVEAYEWVNWAEFRGTVLDGSRDVSPWCVEQVRALPEDPVHAPGAGDEALPPAARP
jgi:isopentenyl-diphosphate delta-isomerase